MLILLDRKGTVEGLQHLLERTVDHKPASGILVLACEENEFTPETIDQLLKQCSKPVFGGIFSRIIIDRAKLRKGTIVAGICRPLTTITIGNLGHCIDLDEQLGHAFQTQDLRNKTMFVFVDGLSSHISTLIESMLNCFGLIPNYIGGGAGSLSGRKPCVISRQGLLEDAAVFALTGVKSGIGVAHGWKPVAGPLKVTEADRHTIISLNWRPAFEAYRHIVETISGQSFEGTDFFELAKGYPFGIAKLDREMVVRDPIFVDQGRLVCVGEIPLNALVYILRGDKDSLIAGAVEARRLAEASYGQVAGDEKGKTLTTFFIDCVSRVLFLQSHFNRELKAVDMGYPLLGALTLGEIANAGKSCLEFYNKTSVVGLLED